MKVKTHRRKHRKNPAQPKAKRRRRRHNPAPSSVTHRRRRRRHNPGGGAGLVPLLIDGAAAASGILGGSLVNNFASKWLPVKYRGVASVAVGGALAVFLGRRSNFAKVAGVSAIGGGLFDLVRQNFPALATFSAEDAAYLLGSASASDPSIAPELARVFGAANSEVPGVLPNVFGAANSEVPGVLPNVFGFDTGTIPMGEEEMELMGFDTGSIPLGDEEGESLFGESYL